VGKGDLVEGLTIVVYILKPKVHILSLSCSTPPIFTLTITNAAQLPPSLH
jgi:hypothetical protein